jgi:hypothetical protein
MTALPDQAAAGWGAADASGAVSVLKSRW